MVVVAAVFLFSEKKGLSKMVELDFTYSLIFFPPANSNQSGPGSSNDG